VSSVALSASCFAQTAKQFVAPHILEKSGALVGVSWNPTGGQRRHILSSGGAITTTSAPIDELVSLYDNADVYQWLMTNLTGKPTPTTYTITSLDKSDTSVLQASMTPFQITFPFCDIDSKDPGGLDVVSAGDVSPGKSSVDLQSAKQTAKKQKAWLCSNFRLTIGNLPCSRVSHIDSFTWTRSGITNPGPNVGIDDSLTDMDFTLPASDIAPFIDAFNSVDAVGAPTSFPVKLEYLDADGNTLMTVLMTCSITGIGRDNMFSDPNDGSALYRVSSHHFVGTVTIVK
jgi:hypothetical protein